MRSSLNQTVLVIPPPTWKKTHKHNKTVSDEAVEKLGTLFSEQLLLAALDLIDRDCGMRKHRPFPLLFCHVTKKQALPTTSDFPTVIKYVSPWGRSNLSVLGMTNSYTVFPSLHQSCSIPFFCTCPAFSFAVLISHSQITVCMCYVLECISSFERLV